MWRGPAWLTVVRDVVCLIVGVVGIAFEELGGKPDLGRLTFFAVLMVAPATLGGISLLQSGTGGRSSLPPPQPQEPSASSPPSSSP